MLPLHSQPIISTPHTQPIITPLHSQSMIHSQHSQSIISPLHSQSMMSTSSSQLILSPIPRFPTIHQLSHSYVLPIYEDVEFSKFNEKDDDFEDPEEENIKQSENITNEKKSEKKGDI